MNIQCKTLEDTKDVINIRKPKKVKRTKIIFITLHKQTNIMCMIMNKKISIYWYIFLAISNTLLTKPSRMARQQLKDIL